MTKKSRRKKRYKQEKPKEKPEEITTPPPVHDRRALEKTLTDVGRLLEGQDFDSIDEMNAFLQDMMESGEPPPSSPGDNPLAQAQDVMYQAWDATGSKQRIALAKKALAISEDCADAYMLLAEETAKSIQEAMALYEKAVKAGERALGPEAFEEYEGHFWGVLETRPYMRARAGLAECLWYTGKLQQAIDHYRDLLRLNPGDNQGLRYHLATLLLAVEDDEALETLLSEYEDDASASWHYTRALLLFRQEGPSEAATALLEEAIACNPFVPPYLLGKKKLPRQMPSYIGFGDENEAIDYAAAAKPIWQKNTKARKWLRETLANIDTDQNGASE